MKFNSQIKAQLAALALTSSALALVMSGCNSSTASTGISPQIMADSLHAVMAADRTVYTKKVVNRLVKEDKVIKASEHWQDEKALPLPAQMFRFGAEMVAEKGAPFSYSLLSLWPINKQNAPKTEVEKVGLEFIKDNPGENYYKEEELGGIKYFTAVYPDPAVAPACVDCHNNHKDTPKSDFQIGDVMGGVVIRIPLS
ncbi:MAG: DUF3365 domain-containing protein [Gammaproteobacteria bacterium]|jgi:hypothetical protein